MTYHKCIRPFRVGKMWIKKNTVWECREDYPCAFFLVTLDRLGYFLELDKDEFMEHFTQTTESEFI